MEQKTKTMVLYVSDMMRLTGRCERTVRTWLAAIKKQNNIKINRPITISEFCNYTGYDPVKVREFFD
jgi:single-stranded DNA-specific DHH superfamily exonuclease